MHRPALAAIRTLALSALVMHAYLCQTVVADISVPPKPLRIGVGGSFADGLDGMLIARGLPHERVFPWELSAPDVLKRFDLLFLSCPAPVTPELDATLEAWVKAGGRLYVECVAHRTGPGLLSHYVAAPGKPPKGSDAVVVDADLAMASGLPAGTPIELYDLTGMLLRAQDGIEARTLARFCPDKGGEALQDGDAVLGFELGQGELVVAGPTLAFGCFRGEATQPLLGAAIAHLIRDRGRPRLTTAEPKPPDSISAAEASDDARTVHTGTPPRGFEPVDSVGGHPYNVVATLGPTTETRGPASMLLLDGRTTPEGKAVQPCLWLALGAKHIQLRRGKKATGAAIASAEWQRPTDPTDLLVRRRDGLVSVLLDGREVLRGTTKVPIGGLVAAQPGMVPIGDPFCQEIGEPALFDNFMREPDDPTEWESLSGTWTNVGVGNENHSVNGFFLHGESTDLGATVTGDWFWEDYTVSSAVRPKTASACGVAALRQPNGDMIAFVADAAPAPWPTLRLVRVADGREEVLAQSTGGLVPEQWYRLAMRARADTLEAYVDGEPVLRCANPEPRGGQVGLIVRGGAAQFDDVAVQPAERPLPLPGGEGTSTPDVPSYVGAEDRLTWANPAIFWVADAARPSLLWHTGDFTADLSVSLEAEPQPEASHRRLILAPSQDSPEAEWLSVTVRTAPASSAASLEVAVPGTKPLRKEASLAGPTALRLERAAGRVWVLLGDSVLQEASSPAGLRRLALEVDGPPLQAQAVRVASPAMRDYVFGAAPTDWRSSAGTWEVAARWACDPRWSFFTGLGEADAAVWYKRAIEGDVTVDYYVGVKMDAPGGSETQRCRDLNTVLCGDGSDPRSGYSFILGGHGGVKTQLMRNGTVVAESPGIRVPSGGVHQEWYHIRAARIGNRVELDLEGRPVFRWEDPDPLPGGLVGLWTRNSGIVVSRVTIWG